MELIILTVLTALAFGDSTGVPEPITNALLDGVACPGAVCNVLAIEDTASTASFTVLGSTSFLAGA